MPTATAHRPAQYEFRVLTLPGTASRGSVRQMLTDEAEYGRWELARTRVYVGGHRRVWLRRKVVRVTSTL
ncbi:conserved hypothetical protein [Beutenbergia cavernae DSM 12333]|uniref:Uncharacterized protein n=1 Tax=Beutenbergia cavernae (strain ATCC BAA-8 / DSM 12333 / CCUG 43141 / JCM 11478 / NBRC 16432 / NCIMB 13614 / HKI 0122) TaxID=471853 RepID=C5BVB6_BEUC1|nr:DUF5703 family protein [Beutenbergia cavernae]ACQ80503.1 conserved hypothetical protein [Beutenbergia cavernae DSM 12333]